jgi:hypothetical protein
MTEPERSVRAINAIWYWLPARWTNGVNWFEISSIQMFGDEIAGGAGVLVSKDDAIPVEVQFTNAELYGEGTQLTPETARARVEAV